MGFFTPPRVAFGPGAIEWLASLPGDQALLIVEPGTAASPGAVALREQRERIGKRTEVLEVPALDLGGATRAGTAARESGADLLVGWGGEELLDVTKVASALHSSPSLDPEEITPLVDIPPGPALTKVLVPSTIGPGNEMSWSAMLRKDGDGPVRELTHRSLAADWVLLDPLLSRSQAPAAVALGAADALSHAFESLSSEWSDAFSEALAKQAVEILFERAPRLLRPDPPEDLREQLLLASGLAGLAQAHAQMGLGHALAHALAPRFGLPHGVVAAVLLPSVLEFTYLAAREKYRQLGRWLGEGAVRSGPEISGRVRELWGVLGIPKDLSKVIPISREGFEAALPPVIERAERFTGVVASGRVPSSAELARLVLCAWDGRPVDF